MPAFSKIIAVLDNMEARRVLKGATSLHFPDADLKFSHRSTVLEDVQRFQPRVVVLEHLAGEFDGLAHVEAIKRAARPNIVLVSNSDRHAARAYDLGVSDFVVLPLLPERIVTALRRAFVASFPDIVRMSPRPERSFEESNQRIRIKVKRGYCFLNTSEIVWIRAAGNYLDVYCVDLCQRIRACLSDFHAQLEPGRFLRIHRSIIVNAAYVRTLSSLGNGEYVLALTNGKELPVSRGCRRQALEQLMIECLGCTSSSDGALRLADPASDTDETMHSSIAKPFHPQRLN